MQLAPLAERLAGTVIHRGDLHRAGYTDVQLRRAVRAGEIEVLRRAWFASASAPWEVRDAARYGGRVTCISLARRRGWWMPDGVGGELHLHFPPGRTGPRLDAAWPGVTHWTRPLAPLGRVLEAGVGDALAHIAVCQSPDAALVLWETAARIEGGRAARRMDVGWRGWLGH